MNVLLIWKLTPTFRRNILSPHSEWGNYVHVDAEVTSFRYPWNESTVFLWNIDVNLRLVKDCGLPRILCNFPWISTNWGEGIFKETTTVYSQIIITVCLFFLFFRHRPKVTDNCSNYILKFFLNKCEELGDIGCWVRLHGSFWACRNQWPISPILFPFISFPLRLHTIWSSVRPPQFFPMPTGYLF